MSEEPPRRTGRFGGIFTALVVAGSAAGVVGWYVTTNRTPPAIDGSGFDLSVAPTSKTVAPAFASAPAQTASSLGMMKIDSGVRIGDSAAPNSSASGPSAAGDKKEQAQLSFTQAARKNESVVRAYAEKMTKKYPIIRQYGRDWMSHPDLRKLNDDYQANHDPIAFIRGLSKSQNLGPMVKKYASAPEIREFIVQGMKEAPGELTGSAMEVLQNDASIKGIISNIAANIGLPPSLVAMISGGDPTKLDQSKVMADMMKDPEMQKALQQGAQQAPAVLLNQNR